MKASYSNSLIEAAGPRQYRTRLRGLVTILCVLLLTPVAQAKQSAGDAALFARLDANGDQKISVDEIADDERRLFERLVRHGDRDEDGGLSHDEFLAALVPSRPEKTLEQKQPSTSPEARAVRWLLLSIDTNANGWIEAIEVPEEFQQAFDAMEERLDADKNNTIDTRELYRGGRPLAQIAGRYVRQNGIDVERELKQLERAQGAAANRFDEQSGPLENLADSRRARQLFAQLDADRNQRLERREVPEPLLRPIQRLFRTADRDGDGALSQREFLAGARRITARTARQSDNSMPASDAMANESMPAMP